MERKLTVILAGDDRSLKRTVDGASTTVGGLEGKLGKLAGAVGGAFAVDKLVDFGGQLLNTGAQLTAIDTKVKTVFEGQARTIREWANKNNESFGVTDDQLAGLAANFGDLLKPMGFTADQAAAMSTDVVGLSGALSAWSGGTKGAAEVSEVLAKAMLGERDGLKELGIAISENDVSQRLAAKGQDKLTGSALEQAKALATQELIFEKSTDAQKAWAQGGNKALAETNKWKAGIAELQEWLATKLVPVLLRVSSFITGTLIPALSKAGQFVSDNKEIFIALAIGIASVLVPAFIAWAVAAGGAALATIAAAAPVIAIGAAIAALAAGVIYAYQHWDFFRNAVDAVAAFVKEKLWPALQAVAGWITGTLIPAIAGVASKVGEWIGIFAGVVSAVSGGVDDIVGFITGLPGRITSAVSGAFDGLKTAFKGAVNWIIRAWNNLGIPSFKIGGYDIPGPGPNVPSFTTPAVSFPNIQPLAKGGIVTGPTLALIGEGRHDEAVIPLDGRRMGNTYNITLKVDGTTDKGEVGRALVEAITAYERRNGSNWRAS